MLKLFIIVMGMFLIAQNGVCQAVGLKYVDLNELNILCSAEKDKVMIINFWASWCAPCIEELPYFKRLKKDLPSVRVLLVNVDFESEVEKKVNPFLAKGQYGSLENIRLKGISADDWMPVVDQDWSGAIPATLILAGGKKKFIDQKFENYNALKTAIQQL